ncbi:MAG: fumarylacetoacetate hydrolase family protein, partial [Rhodospirillales bacterium]|nr:fumarylacetoacetate hydrolase family protein [Rhodospirillales bacterium]
LLGNICFMKLDDAVVENGATIPYSNQTSNLHHENEFVVAVGKDGSVDDALNHDWGYGVGIDFIRRDIKYKAKETDHPWDMVKGFDNSAPYTALRQSAMLVIRIPAMARFGSRSMARPGRKAR